MIRFINVTVGYHHQTVLSDLNYTFPDGVCAILGRSGAGKSTLLKAVAGLLPVQGEILFNDRTTATLRMAPIPQKNSLIPWQTAGENIALPSRAHNRYNSDAAHALCRELGVDGLLDKYPNHLSGGEAQRICLARALSFEPELLLMDECFSALDVASQEEAYNCFMMSQQSHPVSALLVTHSVDEAMRLANHITVLKDGLLSFGAEAPFRPDDRERLVSMV